MAPVLAAAAMETGMIFFLDQMETGMIRNLFLG